MIRKKIKKETRIKVWNKYGQRCAYCGCELDYKKMQVDHIHPFFLGGKDNYSNYNPSCARCNRRKDTLKKEQFRKEIALSIDRLNRDVSGYRMAKDFGLIKETQRKVVFYFEIFEKTK
jgi:5-methylcytosine-specific restriction endonuclease McrA